MIVREFLERRSRDSSPCVWEAGNGTSSANVGERETQAKSVWASVNRSAFCPGSGFGSPPPVRPSPNRNAIVCCASNATTCACRCLCHCAQIELWEARMLALAQIRARGRSPGPDERRIAAARTRTCVSFVTSRAATGVRPSQRQAMEMKVPQP